MRLKDVLLPALIAFASLAVGIAVGLLPDGRIDSTVIVGAIIVAIVTSLPFIVLWQSEVSSAAVWLLISGAMLVNWSWVIYEITKPYEGGGVNFAPMSGIVVCIVLCGASALCADRHRNRSDAQK